MIKKILNTEKKFDNKTLTRKTCTGIMKYYSLIRKTIARIIFINTMVVDLNIYCLFCLKLIKVFKVVLSGGKNENQ